jgi:hypothetical protein
VRSIHARWLVLALVALALITWVALRIAALQRVAFNWDELVLFESIASSARDGIFRSGGRPGLVQLLLTPLIAGCTDEIATGQAARLLWVGVTALYLGGVGALLAEALRGSARRAHDVALGVALLGLLPVFLEWSLQVRTDQLALAGGAWGTAALLASQRKPGLALAAGVCLALGWLASQKLAYVAALAGLLAALRLAEQGFQPQRELLRAALFGTGASSTWLGFRTALAARFELVPGHPARDVLPAPLVSASLDVFDFYRGTIGFSQYAAILPTLLPHLVLLVLMLVATLRLLARGERDARLCAAWLVLATGLGVGLFHAAAFAYFWMTLGLFPAVALALAAEPIRRELFAGRPARLHAAAAALWLLLLVPGVRALWTQLDDSQAVQRDSLEFVHRNFGGDGVGFHPESALFCGREAPLGSWFSYDIYRRFEGPRRDAEIARFYSTFRAEPVRFLVESFRLAQFPPELREFWHANYQPYRASVFVAGRRLRGARGSSQPFELIVPGPYRWIPVGAPASLRVGERRLAPGEVADFAAGTHAAFFDEDVPDGVLVLALDEPPRDAPRAFYKSY